MLMAPYVERDATRSWRSFFRSSEGSSFRIEASMAGIPEKFECVSILAMYQTDYFGNLSRINNSYTVITC